MVDEPVLQRGVTPAVGLERVGLPQVVAVCAQRRAVGARDLEQAPVVRVAQPRWLTFQAVDVRGAVWPEHRQRPAKPQILEGVSVLPIR